MLEEIIEKRTSIAKLYDELLKDINFFEKLEIPDNVRHNYYKYVLFLPKGHNPEKLRSHLKEKYNVSLSGYVYEVPLHRQKVFQNYVKDINSYPIADDLCRRHIALPIYPQMTPEEVKYVTNSIKKSLKELRWL